MWPLWVAMALGMQISIEQARDAGSGPVRASAGCFHLRASFWAAFEAQPSEANTSLGTSQTSLVVMPFRAVLAISRWFHTRLVLRAAPTAQREFSSPQLGV